MQIHRLLPLALCLALMTDTALAVEADDPIADRKDCRLLHSDDERLDCYDKLVHAEVSVATPEASASNVQVPPAPHETQARAPVSAEEVFGLGADEVRRTYEKTTGESDLQELHANVTQIQTIAPKRVSVVLDNGQVWRQVDQSNLMLREGDAILIKKAAFGSFILQKIGSSRVMRVNRTQ